MGKAEKFAKAKKFDTAVILNTRLAPDQFNFTQQVQYMYFMALDSAVGISGKKMPKFAYDETSMKELKKSVQRTVAFLKTVRPHDFEGKEKHLVPYFFDDKKKVTAEEYVEHISVPNFFFHYTLAYAILRHLGLAIGMYDFTGPLPGIKKKP